MRGLTVHLGFGAASLLETHKTNKYNSFAHILKLNRFELEKKTSCMFIRHFGYENISIFNKKITYQFDLKNVYTVKTLHYYSLLSCVDKCLKYIIYYGKQVFVMRR